MHVPDRPHLDVAPEQILQLVLHAGEIKQAATGLGVDENVDVAVRPVLPARDRTVQARAGGEVATSDGSYLVAAFEQ